MDSKTRGYGGGDFYTAFGSEHQEMENTSIKVKVRGLLTAVKN